MSFVQKRVGVQPAVRNLLEGHNAGVEGADQQGGAVFAISGSVGNADDGSAVDIGEIPGGAGVIAVFVNVRVAFDDSGTDLLDVGQSTQADYYLSDVDLSTQGWKATTLRANVNNPLDNAVVVQATYSGANSDSTAGAADVVVLYFASNG